MSAKVRVTVAALAILLLSFRAFGADAKPHITGIYSDLHYNDFGGDLLGTEVFIVYVDNENYVAFFQWWQGGTTPPIVVPVAVTGNTISFTVPAPSCGGGVYQGRVTKTGFDGMLTYRVANGTSKERPIHLKRKQSYWQ